MYSKFLNSLGKFLFTFCASFKKILQVNYVRHKSFLRTFFQKSKLKIYKKFVIIKIYVLFFYKGNLNDWFL